MANYNILDLLGVTDPGAQGQASALADAIRGKRAIAALGAIGSPAMQALGAQYAKDAESESEMMQRTAGQRAGLDNQRVLAGITDAMHRAQLAEQARHNRANESMSRSELGARTSGSGRKHIVYGEGGAAYWADPTDPSAPVTPVVGPEGSQIKKPSAGRVLSDKTSTDLQDAATKLRTLTTMETDFSPRYAGTGGRFRTWTGQKFKDLAPEENQRAAAFWSDYKLLVELPNRNDLFGASLTPTERASWDEASTLTPGTSPKILAQKIRQMREILDRKLTGRAEALRVQGYNMDAVNALTGIRKASGTEAAQQGAASADTATKAADPLGIR